MDSVGVLLHYIFGYDCFWDFNRQFLEDFSVDACYFSASDVYFRVGFDFYCADFSEFFECFLRSNIKFSVMKFSLDYSQDIEA